MQLGESYRPQHIEIQQDPIILKLNIVLPGFKDFTTVSAFQKYFDVSGGRYQGQIANSRAQASGVVHGAAAGTKMSNVSEKMIESTMGMVKDVQSFIKLNGDVQKTFMGFGGADEVYDITSSDIITKLKTSTTAIERLYSDMANYMYRSLLIYHITEIASKHGGGAPDAINNLFNTGNWLSRYEAKYTTSENIEAQIIAMYNALIVYCSNNLSDPHAKVFMNNKGDFTKVISGVNTNSSLIQAMGAILGTKKSYTNKKITPTGTENLYPDGYTAPTKSYKIPDAKRDPNTQKVHDASALKDKEKDKKLRKEIEEGDPGHSDTGVSNISKSDTSKKPTPPEPFYSDRAAPRASTGFVRRIPPQTEELSQELLDEDRSISDSVKSGYGNLQLDTASWPMIYRDYYLKLHNQIGRKDLNQSDRAWYSTTHQRITQHLTAQLDRYINMAYSSIVDTPKGLDTGYEIAVLQICIVLGVPVPASIQSQMRLLGDLKDKLISQDR